MGGPTVLELLQKSEAWLKQRQVASARREADDLLAGVLGVKRLELYLQTDRPLNPTEVDTFRELLQRRGRGEPLAYLQRRAEFYGRTFVVGPGVLIPRPETELLIERALEILVSLPADPPPLVLDLFTGSGCIPLTLAAERTGLRAIGSDLKEEALTYARENLARLGLHERVAFVQGDLFERIPPRFKGKVDLLTANPPYLTRQEMADLALETRAEPRSALDGGEEGLDFYAPLAQQGLEWVKPGGHLLAEIGPSQGGAVARVWESAGWQEVEILEEEVVIQRERLRRPRLVKARRGSPA